MSRHQFKPAIPGLLPNIEPPRVCGACGGGFEVSAGCGGLTVQVQWEDGKVRAVDVCCLACGVALRPKKQDAPANYAPAPRLPAADADSHRRGVEALREWRNGR